MPKVVFFFAGTGDDGEFYALSKENESTFNDDVIRIYIKGCQHTTVGGKFSLEGLRPDLEVAAKNIRSAFSGNKLNLAQLRQNFNDYRAQIDARPDTNLLNNEELKRLKNSGIYTIQGAPSLIESEVITVDEIVLEGFSRGGVTTFATAKQLNDLDIPLHVIANQPVPGGLGITDPLFVNYKDLSHCHNIRSATTLLVTQNLENSLAENKFFHQMMSRFPKETQVKHFLMPHQQHLQWMDDSPIPYHIDHQLAAIDFAQNNQAERKVINWYDKKTQYYFTPKELRQPIYGAEANLEIDPLYQAFINDKAKRLFTEKSPALAKSLQQERETFLNLYQKEQELIRHYPSMKSSFMRLSKVSKAYLYDILKEYNPSITPKLEEVKERVSTLLKNTPNDFGSPFGQAFLFLVTNDNSNELLASLTKAERQEFIAIITQERQQLDQEKRDNREPLLVRFNEQNEPFNLPYELRSQLSLAVNNNQLKAEQTRALLALNTLNIPVEQKVKMYSLVIESSERAIKFAKIINNTTELCDYLVNQTRDTSPQKSALIMEHSASYKSTVFMSCQQMLTLEKTQTQPLEQYKNDIVAAHQTFQQKALGVHRDWTSKVVDKLFRYIIDKLSDIFPSLSKYKDNHCFDTRSTNVTREWRDQLLTLKEESPKLEEPFSENTNNPPTLE